jgi:hypothetical protein
VLDLLSSYKGKRIVVELVNGKQLAGIVIEVGPQDMRMETSEGICSILISAIQVIWETAPAIAGSVAADDRKTYPDSGYDHTQMYARPCASPYGCYEQHNGQPCPQQYGHCPQRFAAPCFNYYFQSESNRVP